MNRSTVRRRRRRIRPAGPVALALGVALCGACGDGTPEPLVTLQPSATTATSAATATSAGTSTAPTTTSAAPTATTTAAPSSPATPRGTRSAPATATAASPSTRPETRSRTTASLTTSATAAPARCRPGQVRAAIAEDDAGAGQRYATLTLRNAGSTRCTVAGYPRLQLLTASGAAVPTRVVPSGAAGRVTLRPGARAAAQLHWSTVPGPGDPSADRCPATPSRVRVAPGGDARPVTIGWDLGPVCGGGRIDAEPLRVG